MKKTLLILVLLINSVYAQTPIDFSLICVDSVWYEPGNPNMINVAIYNGSTTYVNYPVVQIVEPDGDTISNIVQSLSFFGHAPTYHQTYTDTITVTGITDFSDYTFVFYENIWDTSGVIGFCTPTSIKENNTEEINIYPNPVSDVLYLESSANTIQSAMIYNLMGEKVRSVDVPAKQIDVSELKSGVYFLKAEESNNIITRKFLKL